MLHLLRVFTIIINNTRVIVQTTYSSCPYLCYLELYCINKKVMFNFELKFLKLWKHLLQMETAKCVFN